MQFFLQNCSKEMTYNAYYSSGHNSRDSTMTMKREKKTKNKKQNQHASTGICWFHTSYIYIHKIESRSTAMDVGGSHWTVQ